jgi:hypothetical protein
MLDLARISLICLDTRHPDLAVYAMQRCLAQAKFGEAVLLTRDDYRSPDPRITVRAVPPLRSIDDYSTFMVKSLGGYFTGSHALVMQWDSFILDPSAWDPAFLDYDYIGAPWPHRTHPVGNGGFSLRSRRLLDALQDGDIRDLLPEDFCICDTYHDLLVSRYDIRFAPQALASRFSFELTLPDGPCFGFHGLFNFDQALSEAALLAWLEQVEPSVLRSLQGRRLVKNLIRAGIYAPARVVLKVRASGGAKQRLDALKLSARLHMHKLGLKRGLASPDARRRQRPPAAR